MAYLALILEGVLVNKWPLSEEVTILGRSKICDIQIDDQSVSSKHARIISEPDAYLVQNQTYWLEDLNSTNGTQLNAKKISKAKLADGDEIEIGFNRFKVCLNLDQTLSETAIILK